MAESDGEVISINWGGFYSSKDDGKYGVFRLLDFTQGGYHAQFFKETFDHAPSFDEVKGLTPLIRHAPMAMEALLNRDELTLIGHQDLDELALSGYGEYLRQNGFDEPSIKEQQNELIGLSTKEPLKVKLNRAGDQVVVTPAE